MAYIPQPLSKDLVNNMKGYSAGQGSKPLAGLISGITSAVGSAAKIANPISAGIGVAKFATGLMMMRGANKLLPPSEDPSMVAFGGDIERRRKNLMFGAPIANQLNDARRIGANATAGLIDSGDPVLMAMGAGISGQIESDATNKGLAIQAQQETMFTTMAEKLATERSKRKFDIAMYRHLARRAMGTSLMSGGQDDMGMGALSSFNQTT